MSCATTRGFAGVSLEQAAMSRRAPLARAATRQSLRSGWTKSNRGVCFGSSVMNVVSNSASAAMVNQSATGRRAALSVSTAPAAAFDPISLKADGGQEALEAALNDWTTHAELRQFVLDNVKKCRPDRVHFVTGSKEENEAILHDMVQAGTLIKLNDELRPNSYLARSDPGDVARVEQNTFICSEKEEDAGPLNNWKAPTEMLSELEPLFEGSMEGRTMFVVPFGMGPLASEQSVFGVQLTDSPYVVVSMRIMTRMGEDALREIERRQAARPEDGSLSATELAKTRSFVPCLHSVGVPLKDGEADTPWPNSSTKLIVHFPEARTIMSYGSGYGGNALLGKKCLALRIASVMARDEGWMAEHMLILGLTSPEGVKKYVAAAFPSACGKTNLAMLMPSLPGWKVECVGDDIAWMRFDKEGRLRAINPEAGFFGVAPGTGPDTNPNALRSMESNSIFTNVALTNDGDVWWDGLTKEKPDHLKSWMSRDWLSDEHGVKLAAHPNSRFTAPADQCPVMDDAWESADGVPIDAIIFGGRRSTTMPLVLQARDWTHGTYLGAVMNSETTAAAIGQQGVLRPDPFAMKPFCGYNIGDYFNHWLEMESKPLPNGVEKKMPKIFHVNWFRKSDDGKFLWPGFGENSRVLKWIVERCDDNGEAVDTPIGKMPAPGALDLEGLDIPEADLTTLFEVNAEEWRQEADRAIKFFDDMGSRVPKQLYDEAEKVKKAF